MDYLAELGVTECYASPLLTAKPGSTHGYDVFDHSRKYDLRYYVGIARQLRDAGVHVLGIKDMAGLCRPRAARLLECAR